MNDQTKNENLARLLRFCGDESRYSLRQPFTVEAEPGYLYASDAHMLVRVPLDALPTDEVAARLAKREADPPQSAATILGRDVLAAVTWGADFETGTGKTNNCQCDAVRRVHGLRPTTGICPKCEGDGEHDCETCGHSITCAECEGTGQASVNQVCPHCADKNESPLYRVGDLYANSVFVALVRLVYGDDVEWGLAEGKETVFFRRGEAEGCIVAQSKERVK